MTEKDARGKRLEDNIKACYSTWAGTYFDEYFSPDAAYPPVHRDLVLRILEKHGVRSVLDAGCGPAVFLRELIARNIDAYGFDLTPEMVSEARRIMEKADADPGKIWQGSVLDASAFQPPGEAPKNFDAAICIGVLGHVPEEADVTVIENLRNSVRPGGLVAAEARNQFFSLFTMNRYSFDFIRNDLIGADTLAKKPGGGALKAVIETMQDYFQMDLPPLRTGKKDEPGYDEVLSRTHNPLLMRQQFEDAGLENIRVLFSHFHCLPPQFKTHAPDFFKRESLAMENPEDWRGYFMASAFIITGTRS